MLPQTRLHQLMTKALFASNCCSLQLNRFFVIGRLSQESTKRSDRLTEGAKFQSRFFFFSSSFSSSLSFSFSSFFSSSFFPSSSLFLFFSPSLFPPSPPHPSPSPPSPHPSPPPPSPYSSSSFFFFSFFSTDYEYVPIAKLRQIHTFPCICDYSSANSEEILWSGAFTVARKDFSYHFAGTVGIYSWNGIS